MDEGTARRLLKGRPRIDKTTDGLAAVARLCELTDHDAASNTRRRSRPGPRYSPFAMR